MSPCSDGDERDRGWRREAAEHHRRVEKILEKILNGSLTIEGARELYEEEAKKYESWMETH